MNFYFTSPPQARYIALAVLNQTASRDKLKQPKANSAPNIYNHRAFFVRSTRTPKEHLECLSMMARNGQPFAVGCFPLVAVCHPVTRYRQTVTSEAIALNNPKEIATMIHTFIALPRATLTRKLHANPSATKFKLKAQAESRHQARYLLSQVYARQYLLFWIGQEPEPDSAPAIAKNAPILTACNAPSFAMGGRYV